MELYIRIYSIYIEVGIGPAMIKRSPKVGGSGVRVVLVAGTGVHVQRSSLDVFAALENLVVLEVHEVLVYVHSCSAHFFVGRIELWRHGLLRCLHLRTSQC